MTIITYVTIIIDVYARRTPCRDIENRPSAQQLPRRVIHDADREEPFSASVSQLENVQLHKKPRALYLRDQWAHKSSKDRTSFNLIWLPFRWIQQLRSWYAPSLYNSTVWMIFVFETEFDLNSLQFPLTAPHCWFSCFYGNLKLDSNFEVTRPWSKLMVRLQAFCTSVFELESAESTSLTLNRWKSCAG